MFFVGVDCGSRMIKCCLIDREEDKIVDCYSEDNQQEYEIQIKKIINKRMKACSIREKNIGGIGCTGYGKNNFQNATKYSSEIICHAKGVNYIQNHFSELKNIKIKTIVDIGGQDSKIIKVENDCIVLDFVMNDKCAAGTGRFLERVAQLFNIEISSLGRMSELSDKTIEINSTCVVFAESEIISYVSMGEKKENIINAVHRSLIHSVASMNGKIKFDLPITFVGGVSKNCGMVKSMNEYFNTKVYVPPLSDMTGAIGAAISSYDSTNR